MEVGGGRHPSYDIAEEARNVAIFAAGSCSERGNTKGVWRFNVENSVELRESQNMKVSELAKAQELAEEHRQLILEKWHEHLGGQG
jgi:hypothetical protein